MRRLSRIDQRESGHDALSGSKELKRPVLEAKCEYFCSIIVRAKMA